MRFMLMMYPQVDEADWTPTAEAVEAMGRYNDELTKAGVLLALDGLRPSADGARVVFSGGRSAVTDGPFTETKELVGGYWIIEVASPAEAVEWATRCPGEDCMIEVRRIAEMSDFPDDVQRAAAGA